MTMVALVRFNDADIVLADSRVSWGIRYSQDSLLKIFRIDLNKIIAFSGDVSLASQIFNNIGRRGDKRPPQLEKLVSLLPRISKRLYKERPESLNLILGGYNHHGDLEWFHLFSPNFRPKRISDIVFSIGSGSRVSDYINPAEIIKLEEDYPHLQQRTTVLISKFDIALRHMYEPTVGGMLQVVSMYDGVCHPIFHGSYNFDPQNTPVAKQIDINDSGQLVQHNMISGYTLPLKYPSAIVNEKQPTSIRFEDYTPIKPPKT